MRRRKKGPEKVAKPGKGRGGKRAAKQETLEGQCWICLDDDKEGMISPCDCKGSMGSVHEECLLAWIKQTWLEERGYDPRCPHCGAQYQLEREIVPSEEEEEEEEAVQVRGLLRPADVAALAECVRDMPPGEEKDGIIVDYLQHLMVLLPALALSARLAQLLATFAVFGDSSEPLLRGQSPFERSTLAGHLTSLLGVLSSVLWQDGASPAPPSQPEPWQLEPHPSGVSLAWSATYILMMNACHYCLFLWLTCSLACQVLDRWLPEGPLLDAWLSSRLAGALQLQEYIDDSEYRQVSFVVLLVFPQAVLLSRVMLIRAFLEDGAWLNWLLPCEGRHFLLFVMYRVLSSYVLAGVFFLASLALVCRTVDDLVVTMEDDIEMFRSYEELKEGRLRIRDRKAGGEARAGS